MHIHENEGGGNNHIGFGQNPEKKTKSFVTACDQIKRLEQPK